MIAPVRNSALLLTAREAAEALAISERTLARVTVPHGDLPVLRLGDGQRKLLRYRPEDVQRWIDRHVQGAEHENGDGEQIEHDVQQSASPATPRSGESDF